MGRILVEFLQKNSNWLITVNVWWRDTYKAPLTVMLAERSILDCQNLNVNLCNVNWSRLMYIKPEQKLQHQPWVTENQTGTKVKRIILIHFLYVFLFFFWKQVKKKLFLFVSFFFFKWEKKLKMDDRITSQGFWTESKLLYFFILF